MLRRRASSHPWITTLLAVCVLVVVPGALGIARADSPLRGGVPRTGLPAIGADARAVTPSLEQPTSTPPSSAVPPPTTQAPTTTSPPQSRSGVVFVVGDSLTVGTEPWLSGYLQSSGWRLAGTDARVGRGVAEGLAVLQAHSSNLPDTVLIALGTNDYNATPNAVATWLRDARAIVGSRRLVWVNLCLDDRADPRLGGFRRVNAALATFAASDGVDVADWCSFASARGVNPGPDGIHYASGGYRIRAAFYAASLTGQA